MKIIVESPFNRIWKHAYLIRNRENRNMVCLVNKRQERTTISYARYLMSVKLNRFLSKDEEVDHIDNDKTNDSIENLQILSSIDNKQKFLLTFPHHLHGTGSMYKKGCRCDLCRQFKAWYWRQYRNTHPEYVEKMKIKRREKRLKDKV